MKRFYSNGFQFDNYNQQNDFYPNECGELIVGCVVGTFLPSSMHNVKTGRRDETAELLIADPDEYPEMFYIMTLGTTRDFRRVGLGSILVNRVVDMIRSKQECGALYLHVIIYNEGAIKLYERLGFSRVKRITGEREALNLESKMHSYLCSNTSLICLHFLTRLLHNQFCKLRLLSVCTLFSRKPWPQTLSLPIQFCTSDSE